MKTEREPDRGITFASGGAGWALNSVAVDVMVREWHASCKATIGREVCASSAEPASSYPLPRS